MYNKTGKWNLALSNRFFAYVGFFYLTLARRIILSCYTDETYRPEIEIFKEGKVYDKTSKWNLALSNRFFAYVGFFYLTLARRIILSCYTDETYRPEIEIFKEGKVYNKTSKWNLALSNRFFAYVGFFYLTLARQIIFEMWNMSHLLTIRGASLCETRNILSMFL